MSSLFALAVMSVSAVLLANVGDVSPLFMAEGEVEGGRAAFGAVSADAALARGGAARAQACRGGQREAVRLKFPRRIVAAQVQYPEARINPRETALGDPSASKRARSCASARRVTPRCIATISAHSATRNIGMESMLFSTEK
ncbi:hypothetical protein [Paraburkholderia sp. J94]|uniref:hypothetical protein n=1 Tax=Paraburkholderia sp. J94 TaxID=2805441 RepID=UPI002AB1086E|nr:hypothetical protein [Paraburkholderia sp. J94]